MSISSFHITDDDLPDADKKTRRAISPLLDALNRCLGPLSMAFAALVVPSELSTKFITAPNGSAYLTIGVGQPIARAWIGALTPLSGTIDSVWSMSFVPTSNGAQLLFVGLTPLQTYNVTVMWK